MSLEELANWLEWNVSGFYMGCRVDPHSPQVRQFVDALHYYLEKDFGYVSERREEVVIMERKLRETLAKPGAGEGEK